MTSPLAVSPATVETKLLELSIADFLKSTDAFPLYLLILMIFYFVLLHYWPRDVVRVLPLCGHEFHAFCIDKWFQLRSTCPSCRIIPVAHIRPI
ncbi:hypothetical protein N665_1013s0009 [Sinapis alba]|nr:hypothetical protein N665_1013s0009 [Sinapis alba]